MRNRSIMIAPSLLASDFGELRRTVRRINGWGVDRIHIDVMDGHFVPNITFGPQMIASIRKATKLPFETHLMIENPHRYIKEFVDAGSDIVIVHCETGREVMKSIGLIRRFGARAGVAINPETRFAAAQHYIQRVDTLLIMGVHPGFGGQKFIQGSLQKIRQARERADKTGSDALIAVDGGIDEHTGRQAVAAGAQELVIGTALFGASDVHRFVKNLKKTYGVGLRQ